MVRILFAASAKDWEKYGEVLKKTLDASNLIYQLTTDINDVDAEYIVYAPSCGLTDFSRFKSLKAILSLWAGVENITGNRTINAPLCRMVDIGLTQGMVEWVTGHVLRHHLDLDGYLKNQDGRWQSQKYPPLASERSVTILGLGALGLACANALTNLNFKVHGWSRRKKNNLKNIETYSGDDGLYKALSFAEILVLLLPLTNETDSIINSNTLKKMPRGSIIINPGRGHLIDDLALLASIKIGHIRHATLDVFREEPLPKSHPYWKNDKVTVTPHIASVTRANTSCKVIVENIIRGEAGQSFLYQVDRVKGY